MVQTANEGRRARGLGVRTVLSLVILLTGLLTAGLIHGLWTITANRNLRDVVTQLNRQIVSSVQQELANLLAGAEAARESVRTIFFQGVVAPNDEAKREFIFLSSLQSHPSFSWIALGFPNGDFFGTQKPAEGEIRMVEVRRNADTGNRELRVDRYRTVTGDIEFQERLFSPTDFLATAQPWYFKAENDGQSVWSEVMQYPTRIRPGIATSTKLVVYQETVGVLSVAIELERLSRFLASLSIGKTGAAFILASDGRVIASSGPQETPASEEQAPPWLLLRDGGEPMLSVTADALRSNGVLLETVTETRQLEYNERASGKMHFVSVTPLPFEGWVLATVIPADDFLGEISENNKRLLWALVALVAAISAAAVLLANNVFVRPVQRITLQLRNVERFMLDRIERVHSPLAEFDHLSSVLVQMGQGLASFQKFLPTELVRTLVAHGMQARPGGERRELSIMFTDLVGFTRLSERLGNEIVPVLADYLGRMSQEIHDSGGTVDKFIGDAVMAFWNAPLADPEHALHACQAALRCQAMLASMRAEAEASGQPALHMRIGINTGEVLVGNIGSETRLNYTVIGDPVNLASRLEALNKRYGSAILIGADTEAVVRPHVVTRRLDRVAVYGRAGGTDIYELLGLAAAVTKPDWALAYESGLARYFARDWDSAEQGFRQCLRLRPEDPAAELMLERVASHRRTPPPVDWQGIEVQTEK